MSAPLRVALAHLAPRLGDRPHNRGQLAAALGHAAAQGARWLVAPELALCGYDFAPAIGTDWIRPLDQDGDLAALHAVATGAGVALLLSHPVRDGARLTNAVVLLGRGAPRVVHEKQRPIPGVEAWCSRGAPAAAFALDGLPVGALVCADAWTPEPAATLRAGGARLLVSCAAWPPEPHGPEGCWERRTAETGLALLVANRVGAEPGLDFAGAATGVYADGRTRAKWDGPDPAVLVVDLDPATGAVTGAACAPLARADRAGAGSVTTA